jgi:hypothetical protein
MKMSDITERRNDAQGLRLDKAFEVCSKALANSKRGDDRIALSSQLIQIEIALALNNAVEILEELKDRLPQQDALVFDPSSPTGFTRKG